MTALEMMSRKAHPALQIPLNLTPSDTEKEFEAAYAAGYVPDEDCLIDAARNWFELPRTLRAKMVAYLKVAQLTAVISAYDAAKYRELKAGIK